MKFECVYEYDNDYDLPIEHVWQRLSDTNRGHEISGAESYHMKEVIQSDKSIMRHCHGYIDKANLNLEFWWKERFSEWKAPYYLRQQRNYSKPFSGSIVLECNLSSTPTGTHVHAKLIFLGDSLLGWLCAKLGFFKKSADIRINAVKKIIHADDISTIGQQISSWKKPSYTKSTFKRVGQLIEKIDTSSFGHHLGHKIANMLMYSLIVDVSRIRPLELALKWKIAPEDLTEALMQAMVYGLVDMRWDILCPQCRTSKSESGGLHDIPKSVHCPTCNIDFSLNFNENVEMTFLPSKWLRPVGDTSFCMLSAQLTPHIITQLRIRAEKEKILEQPLKPGTYRCRILEDQHVVEFTISPEDNKFPVIELFDNQLTINPSKCDFLTMKNHIAYARYFLIEDLSYRDNALTCQRVMSMHAFRQLCPEQLIKAGDNVGISQLTILFTDLKDSTAFYYEVGEANAYHIVREHFSFLSEIIYKHHGAVVKTIGDSVMAVFYDPKDSVEACLDIRKRLEEFNRKYNTNITIKLGVHQDNCVAVNINNIMDYFGIAVNVTARLHGLSDGNDVIVSDEMMKDPAVGALLRHHEKTKCSEMVKGVPKPVEFYRITPK